MKPPQESTGESCASGEDSTPRPWLIALRGLPGAGKSRLARALAPRLGAVIVDRDALRAALFSEIVTRPEAKEGAWAVVEAATRARLAAGLTTILDGATLLARLDRERVRRCAHETGARLLFVTVECPLELAVDRVEADRRSGAHQAPDRTAALVRAVAARAESFRDDEPPQSREARLVLDAGQETTEQLARVLLELAEPTP